MTIKRWVVMESSYRVENNKPVVMLFSRNYDNPYETVTHKFTGFKPYFYAPADEAHRTMSSPHIDYMDHETEYLDALGRSIRRVYTHLPADVTKVRERFTFTCAADLIFDKRFLIDKKIKYAYQLDTSDSNNPIPIEVDHPMDPRIVYCDIEVLSPEGVFPDARWAKYPIISIQCMDSYTKNIVVFTYRIPPTDDPVQYQCHEEEELIKDFCSYIKEINPDIIGFWNGDSFDVPYLINRAKNIEVSLKGFSRYGEPKTFYEESGPRKGYTNRVGGRATLDMMEAFKKYTIGGGQRESNGLKSVISDDELLNVYDKEGNLIKEYAFTYNDLGPILQKVLDEHRYQELIDYCKNDVIALQHIDEALGLYKYFESIRFIAGNKIMDGLHNSKIIKMLLMHEGIKPMPTVKYGSTDFEKFDGALVVEPQIGIHHNVGTVDVAALYPNIMVGFNVSADIDNITISAMKKIMALREHYRALKKKGVHGADALDSSCKTISNSFYGVLGSPVFPLYNRDNALFVTSTGQDINRFIQACCEEKKKMAVVYGDSVSNDTIIRVFNSSGNSKNVQISKLFTKVDFTKGDKEYCNLTDVYVESIDNNGKMVIENVPYVMRHKCNKQMYRVSITNRWHIDVTEDHSLFGYANKNQMPKALTKYRAVEVKPTQIGDTYKSIITRKTLHRQDVSSINLDSKLYEYIGYHVGNGSIHYNREGYERTSMRLGISFGDDAAELYKYFISWLVSNNHIFDVKEDSRNNGDFRFYGTLIEFIEKNVGHSKEKVIPEFMFSETEEHICEFVRGYFTADGTVLLRSNLPIVRLTSINYKLLEGVQTLLYSVGITSSIFTENVTNNYNGKDSGTYSSHLVINDVPLFKQKIGFITNRKQDRLEKTGRSKTDDGVDWSFKPAKVETIEYDGYVYDLHCKTNHRFFANDILAHNTDSVFVTPVYSGDEAIQLQNYLNEKLIEWCREKGCTVDISLKAEKLFSTLMFKAASGKSKKASKKKYAGHLIWKEGEDKDELAFMGIELARSDSSNMTKNCLETFLNKILIEDDRNGAVTYIKSKFKDVINGTCDIYDISIPKAVRSLNADSPHKRGIEYTKVKYSYNIAEGSKPRLLYLRSGEMCIDEDFDLTRLNEDIDWKKMADKTIKSKMESYMDTININWDAVIEGQTSIDAWF